MRGSECNEIRHPATTAPLSEAQIVACHKTTHTVAHDVDLLAALLFADLLDIAM